MESTPVHRYCMAALVVVLALSYAGCSTSSGGGDGTTSRFYTVSVNAIPGGTVPTGATSFDFKTDSILSPSVGYPIDVRSLPGFRIKASPLSGFDLASLLLSTNGNNTYFQAHFTNSSNGQELVLNILPDPPSLLSVEGVYPLWVSPNLIIPGNTSAATGDSGQGSLWITSGGSSGTE